MKSLHRLFACSSERLPHCPTATRRAWALGTALLAFSVFTVFPGTAHADGTRLALDLDYVNGVEEPSVDPGVGASLRLGRKLDLALVSLTPEIGGGFHAFGGPADVGYSSGFIGGRLGFLKGLEPGAFAHFGVGHIGGEAISETAPAVDVGLTLDLTLVPLIDVGVHAGYNALLIQDANSFDWYNVGVHAALAFF